MLFNKTRQYNIQIFDKISFYKYRTRELKAAVNLKTFIILCNNHYLDYDNKYILKLKLKRLGCLICLYILCLLFVLEMP